MLQILGEITAIAGQSIAEQKVKHAVAAGTAGAGMMEASADQINLLPGWFPLGEVVALAGLALTCLMFYKTYLEVTTQRLEKKKKQLEIAILDRRVDH
jgi:hypothetical protein